MTVVEPIAPDLAESLRGDLLGPDHEAYEEARQVYNGMIDRRPRLIARCVDVADVIAAVNFARDNEILLSVRGGGHNAGGLGVADDALVIDLSNMKGVRVDPAAREVRAAGGSTWGEVYHATPEFGHAKPIVIILTSVIGGVPHG